MCLGAIGCVRKLSTNLHFFKDQNFGFAFLDKFLHSIPLYFRLNSIAKFLPSTLPILFAASDATVIFPLIKQKCKAKPAASKAMLVHIQGAAVFALHVQGHVLAIACPVFVGLLRAAAVVANFNLNLDATFVVYLSGPTISCSQAIEKESVFF